jgi:hypothetical protein
MPAKGKSRITKAQKLAVAAGRAAGKTIPEIAADVGIAPSTAAHVATSREVRGIIDRIFADETAMFVRLMASTVASVEADMAGAKLSPEQRSAAREQALRILQLGQPAQPQPAAGGVGGFASGGGFLLGDVLAVYRSAVQAAGGAPAGAAE